MRLSSRVRSLSEAGTVAVSSRAAELASSGRDILNLGAGAPNFDTPAHVSEAAIDAIRRGETRYTSARGLPALRDAIRLKFARENGLEYGPDAVTIGTGAKQVLLNVLLATVEPDDEMVIPAPYYASYPDIVRLASGTPVIVECPAASGFKLSPEALEHALTPRTRWLVVNSPSNPTGAVYSRAEMRALAEVLHRHPNVYVLSDEIYEHCLYTDEAHVSVAALDDDMFARTVTVNGVSKTYGMTGWRIGFAGGPVELMQAATRVQGQSTTCASSIGQVAAAEALRGPQGLVRERQAALRQLRDRALRRIAALDAFTCVPPDGALYLYVGCERLIGRRTAAGAVIADDIAAAEFLLDAANVAVIPGAGFGASPYFRATFAIDPGEFDAACGRIAATLETLR